MSTAQITVPLDIPDIRVLQTQLTASNSRFEFGYPP
jgi:hypothetical protein